MIIIKMGGGLGNQLFQYSLGKNLAIKNDTEVKIDTRDYIKNIRSFQLPFFNISGQEISDEWLKNNHLPDMYNSDILTKIFRKTFKFIDSHKKFTNRQIIIEKSFPFDEKTLTIRNKKSIYLIGNWQSEKYFFEISNILKKEFTLKNELSPNANNIEQDISSANSVSLHIRRGDYLISEKNKNFYGTCPLPYYHQATKLIEEKISNPTYFIFSDDIEWVKENLKLNNPVVYVSGQGIPDYEELILMSHCQHNIIANSTFSWWGAWLNNNPDKIVITPEKWFNSDTDTRDLIPDGWIKL